ncbi:acetylornithine deacetylase [Jiella sp. MQZ9-1]|uniref:Acetylornithine deacetylase n=1 Tax=Jiella flava TaxID=2816857 RepID=A0A939FW49_9HYPH|nr:acetylornithine deacetylase [Jiella flava]MBO0662550.1 acetylornithine deacetylase [Jiella flava]MCD2472921.1 acetylornithine deacetylase [Jiella flava]
MNPQSMLSNLVAFASVVGTPNGGLIDFIRDFLAGHGVPSVIVGGPEGDRFNLFATLGPVNVPGYILSAHTDVVPATEPAWKGDPFHLRAIDDRLIGRGAVDMKGFVAAVLSAVPQLVCMDLERPIHIALSYDEEAGCRGVPHLIEKLPTLCAPPVGCIVGEPSGLVPVLRHKGKAALRIAAKGLSGHSSRPDLGQNAIHALLPTLGAVAREAERQGQEGPMDAHFAPPYSTLQIGRIAGGEALNIIPDTAIAEIEARAIAGVDPLELLNPALRLVENDERLSAQVIASYPGLSMTEDHPLARFIEGLSGNAPLAAVSYGTEAGLYQQAGIPAIVCGPGDIARAHKPEEYITTAELHGAQTMVLRLGRALSAGKTAFASGRV